jgi:hypothetical protein
MDLRNQIEKGKKSVYKLLMYEQSSSGCVATSTFWVDKKA